MDKEFLRKCLDTEVYHWAGTQNTRFINKIWFRFFQPEANAVYLVRIYQYHVSKKGFYHKIRAKLLEVVLMRRYGIFIGQNCTIDLGFRIWHPHGIIINDATIGKNFNVNQNTTVGAKVHGSRAIATIGDNCCMYANSSIIGDVTVGNAVVLGAHALLLNDAIEAGTYVGIPAKRIKE